MDCKCDLIRRRLELYPDVYRVIATVSLELRSLDLGSQAQPFTLLNLRNFHRDYLAVNAQVGVLFSSHASNASWRMRVQLGNMLNGFRAEPDTLQLNFGELQELLDSIQRLEVALKQDLGVFEEEFGLSRREQPFNSYQELGQWRNG